MKNPDLVAKISLTVLALLLVIIFLAGVVIPNMVAENPDSHTFIGVTLNGNSS